MIRAALAIASCGVLLSISPLHAQTREGYREFALGSPLVRVMAQTDATLPDVTRLHERPALIQQLRWRIPYLAVGTNEPRKDTEGMTDSDMIAALSERYGSPVRPLVPPKSPNVARWDRDDVAVALLRNAFTDGFQLVVTSKRLDNLARVAAAEAVKLDVAAAPALELARQQRDADNDRDAKERARVANKASFTP